MMKNTVTVNVGPLKLRMIAREYSSGRKAGTEHPSRLAGLK